MYPACLKRASVCFLFFFFLSSAWLLSEELDFFNDASIEKNSFSTTEGLLSTLVANHVSVITGDFVYTTTDCELVGPEPLLLQRNFSSSLSMGLFGMKPDHIDPSIIDLRKNFCGWQLNYYTTLFLHAEEKTGGAESIKVKGFVPHLQHGQMFHKNKLNIKACKKGKGKLPLFSRKGVTNCSSGMISARTNPKNIVAYVKKSNDKKDDREFCSCEVRLGSGDRRYYTPIKEHCENFYYNKKELFHRNTFYSLTDFLFEREKKANGNQIILDPNLKLRTCNATDSTTFGWITIRGFKKNLITIETSHCPQPIQYHYTRSIAKPERVGFSEYYTLKKLVRPDRPEESYEYSFKAAYDGHLLSKKILPDNRFLEIDYYKMGEMAGTTPWKSFRIKSRYDPRLNRVKCLKAPVGHDATPIVTHRFLYDMSFKTDGIKQSGSFKAGVTTVYDAYDRQSKYFFNDQHRLKRFVQYANQKPYRETKYLWDDFIDIKTAILLGVAEDSPSENECNLMGKIIKNSNGEILTGRIFDYDKKGNVISDDFYGNLTGNLTTLPLLKKGRKPKIIGAECYRKRFNYSSCKLNLLWEEEEGNGRKVNYRYIPGTDLIRRKFLLDQERIVAREFYDYDENNALITYISDNGSSEDHNDLSDVTERHITRHVTRKTIPVGLPQQTDEFVFDFESGQEKIIKTTFQEYSLDGKLIKKNVYDACGEYRYSLEWEYDAHGNLTKEINAIGEIIRKKYDLNDNLIYEEGPSTDLYTLHSYDFSNRLISSETHWKEECFTKTYRYDLVGNRIAEVNRYGHETLYFYDDLNRLIKIIYPEIETESGSIHPTLHKEYDCLGHLIKEVDAQGYATVKTYNSRGKVTSTLLPNGQQEKFEYNLAGNLIKKTASNGTSTHFEWDCFGRILKESAYSASGDFLYENVNVYDKLHKISSTDALGLTTLYRYNHAGKLMETICGDKVEAFKYDALGRLCKKKEFFEQGQVKVSSIELDLLDRVTEERIEDEAGIVLKRVSYRYDDLGNRSEVIEESEAGQSRTVTHYNLDKKPIKTINPEGIETHTTYDYHFRNHLGQNVLQTTTTDAYGRRIVVTYNALEEPVEIKHFDLLGTLIQKRELLYDLRGNITSLIEHVIADGEKIRTIEIAFSYDEIGQVTNVIEAKGAPEQKSRRIQYNSYGEKSFTIDSNGVALFFFYDALGRLKTYHSNDGTLSYRYHYNRRNQVVEVEDLLQKNSSLFFYDLKGNLINEQLANGLSISYQYDCLKRVTELQLPDESLIHYHYDSLNLKRVERIKEGKSLYTHYYNHYDAGGLNLQATTIHQEEIFYTYDLLKRPLSMDSQGYTQRQTHYDRAGRLQSFESTDLKGQLLCKWSYDDHDHLVREEGIFNNLYVCDSVHNRLKKNNQTHLVNGLNQLLDNGHSSYRYDLAGNLVSSLCKEKRTDYEYDAHNRLVLVRKEGRKIRYLYDAFHRRMAKIENGITTRYLYTQENEIGCVDEAGTIQELRVLGQGRGAEIGASVALELKGRVFVPYHDFRGNLAALGDFSGRIVETYRYSAFGELLIFDGEGEPLEKSLCGNPWLFSSKRLDEETGFFNFGNRYYCSENGRWITMDPSGLVDGINLYAYLHHRPGTTFDLYGLQEEKERQDKPYYPLENVDRNDRFNGSNPSTDGEPNQAPPGFVDVKAGKKSKHYYCGFSQVAQMGITFVNGIMNKLNDAHESAKNLSTLAGGHFVNFVYNESHSLFYDLTRSFFELVFHMETEAVLAQRRAWDAKFTAAGENEIILHVCHSEGTIITRNALENYPAALKQRMIIQAFGPACYINDPHLLKIDHHASKRDPVTYLDLIGAYQCRHTTTRYTPHKDAPLFDHSLSSPTYQGAMNTTIKNYCQEYGRN